MEGQKFPQAKIIINVASIPPLTHCKQIMEIRGGRDKPAT